MELNLNLRPYIELASLVVETLAIIIIIVSIFYGLVRYVGDAFIRGHSRDAYQAFKVRLGGALLLGLEILVAADVIRTVALEPTLDNVIVLGLLVIIRTFLSWSLVVEIEGRFPWQRKIETTNVEK
jgi:uncharacterized membrane protein